MAACIELAEERHVARMLEIYAPIVASTAISFEREAPGAEAFGARVRGVMKDYPWLACTEGDAVLGYAYATSFRGRPAYRWSVETTVYVGDAHQRRGVARGLYASLLMILRAQGFHRATAGIALPNEGSVRLHESLGFERVGVFTRTGFKLGAWHDVEFWELELAPLTNEPAPPLSLEAVRETPAWTEALARGSAEVDRAT